MMIDTKGCLLITGALLLAGGLIYFAIVGIASHF